MNKRLLIFAVTGLLLLLAVPLTLAGSDCGCSGEDEVDSVQITFRCDNLNIRWSHGSGDGSIVLVGSFSELLDIQIYDSPSGSFSMNFDPPLDPETTLVIIIGIFEGTIDESEEIPTVGEPVAFSFLQVNCGEDDDQKIRGCLDGRLTFDMCQPLVVYPLVSDDGVGWNVYLVGEEDGVGHFMFYVPAETFDALPDEVAENCTVDHSDDGQVVMYLLSSGEFQINVGPDHEGKHFVYIFNDLLSPPVKVETFISGLPPEILPMCIQV